MLWTLQVAEEYFVGRQGHSALKALIEEHERLGFKGQWYSITGKADAAKRWSERKVFIRAIEGAVPVLSAAHGGTKVSGSRVDGLAAGRAPVSEPGSGKAVQVPQGQCDL